MRTVFRIALVVGLFSLAGTVFGQLRLVPMKYSKVKLVSGKRSAIVDLEDALLATSGTLAGNPPHSYRVLFTASKAGYLYLVANVQSHSPISDKNAPCGGDSPQGILWIKADKLLKTKVLQSEIYESCSYNYYGSKLRVTKSVLKVAYGGRERKELIYDNKEPEKGLVVGSHDPGMITNIKPN